MRRLTFILAALLLPGCVAVSSAAAPAASPASAGTSWTLVATYPHDPMAFTQGLFWQDGILFESTGLEGRSDLRQVQLNDGKVLKRTSLEPKYFGEGIVGWKGKIISLTWRDGTGWVWDAATLMRERAWTYPGEGWALTHDGKQLIMSDGTAQLRFLDPERLVERRRVTVTWQGRPVDRLNELEYVKGEVLANIWLTNRIARIDPETGVIRDFIDVSALAARAGATDREAIPNGIAYDPKGDRLFVTGKLWPRLFEIRLQR